MKAWRPCGGAGMDEGVSCKHLDVRGSDAALIIFTVVCKPAEPVASAVLAPLSSSSKPLKEPLVTQLGSCIGQVMGGPSCQSEGLSYSY